jgi:hypothetical protein
MADLNDIVATVVYDSFFAPAASADWMLASWPHLFLRRRHSEAWLSLKGVTGSAFTYQSFIFCYIELICNSMYL